MLSSTLQFNLSMGIVGVIYMSIILMYTLGTLVAGQLTERLVRVLQQREKLLASFPDSPHLWIKSDGKLGGTWEQGQEAIVSRQL